ncbi:hypothetical protein HN587_06515 [Candidatus Woesearchaeota archaeon]|jgi:hypothetical protein|nr:hypothetical protein [Candidatus Woesearchaeota archaeon]
MNLLKRLNKKGDFNITLLLIILATLLVIVIAAGIIITNGSKGKDLTDDTLVGIGMGLFIFLPKYLVMKFLK